MPTPPSANESDPDAVESTATAGQLPVAERLRRWRPVWLAVLLAAFPVLWMGHYVHGSTEMNYQDYWDAMLRIMNPDGSLHARGLFSYQNEHPFLIPQIIFYLDARLGYGTNRELGWVALILAIITLYLLWRLLPRQWSGFQRAVLLAVASFITLCPSGGWNYVKGMSGDAWFAANVFALAALLTVRSRRPVVAVIGSSVLAGLSIASYGTGFAAPAAVVILMLLLGQGWRRWGLPLAVLVVALAVYKATASSHSTGIGISHDPALLLQTFLTNMSTLWDPAGGSFGLICGAGGLAVAGLCFVQYWSRRDELADLAPWWAVAVYALGASVLISLGRSELFLGDGAQARYVSLSALFWVALVVIVLRTAPDPRQFAMRSIGATLAVVVFWAASPSMLNAAVNQRPNQDVLAAAVRYGAADRFATVMRQPDDQIVRLKNLHNYPFVSGYESGCGYKPGDHIDVAKLKPVPTNVAKNQFASTDSETIFEDTREIVGWAYRFGTPLSCALVVNDSGDVVGGGTVHMPRSDVQAQVAGLPLDIGFDVVTDAHKYPKGTGTLILGFSDGLYTLALPGAK